MVSGRLLGPVQIRDLALRLGVRPTKALGQNFVHDPNTVRRIVKAADLDPADVVIEVGPGLGSLTLALLPATARVIAVEIDAVLAAALPDTVAQYVPAYADRLQVLTADALRLRASDLAGSDLAGSDLAGSAPTALVANLPYNVAVPVVLHLLAVLPSLRHGLVMVQKEVADRLVAEPGSKVYGIPSVKLAWYAAARQAGRVPPNVFWPVPNVDSGLVSFTRREPPRAGGGADVSGGGEVSRAADSGADGSGGEVSRAAVFAVVDAAFAQRRKTLRAALAGWAGGGEAAAAILTAAGVDPGARGESLGVAQFTAIAAAHHGFLPRPATAV